MKKKKQLSLKNAIFGGRKKFLSTRKNNNEGYVDNKNYKNSKRMKRNDEENLIESIDSDFFQGSNENLTTREEYFFTTQEINTDINTDYYQRNHQFTKRTMTMSSEEFPNDYDYEKLKNEYLQQIDEMKRKNEIFIYTESENFEETTTTTTIIVVNNKSLAINKNLNVTMKNNQIFKEANNKSLNENNGKNIKIKKLLNCTKIESFFIGPKTIECLSNAYKNIKSLLDLLKALQRTWNVTKFWILLYISISIACWCQRGDSKKKKKKLN